MPYGIDKKQGGDSPENVKWMENCVSGKMGQKNPRTGKNFTKSEAIALCKYILKKKKEK